MKALVDTASPVDISGVTHYPVVAMSDTEYEVNPQYAWKDNFTADNWSFWCWNTVTGGFVDNTPPAPEPTVESPA